MQDYLSGGERPRGAELRDLAARLFAIEYVNQSLQWCSPSLRDPATLGWLWELIVRLTRERGYRVNRRTLFCGRCLIEWIEPDGLAESRVIISDEDEAGALASALLELLKKHT